MKILAVCNKDAKLIGNESLAFNVLLNVRDMSHVQSASDQESILTKYFEQMMEWLGDGNKEAIEAFPSFMLALSRLIQQCPKIRKTFRRLVLPGQM